MKPAPCKKDRLAKLVKAAEAETARLLSQMQTAQSLDMVAQKALSKKFRAANQKSSNLHTIVNMSEESMMKRLDYAKESRKRAFAYSAPLRKTTLARAAKFEREYLLWCAHHQKEPTLLVAPPLPDPKPKAPEPAPSGYGGRRKGAGRKPSGNKQLLLRVKPQTAKRLKEVAKTAGFATPGEWLDAQMAQEKS